MALREETDYDSFLPKQTLQEVIDDASTLPVVIRTVQEYRNYSTDDMVQIQPGTVIYIECKKMVQYVHIKVLDVHNEEEASMKHGSDFIYERGIYLGEEYLIPLKYPGKLKFEYRPGRRTRYGSIAQVNITRDTFLLHRYTLNEIFLYCTGIHGTRYFSIVQIYIERDISLVYRYTWNDIFLYCTGVHRTRYFSIAHVYIERDISLLHRYTWNEIFLYCTGIHRTRYFSIAQVYIERDISLVYRYTWYEIFLYCTGIH